MERPTPAPGNKLMQLVADNNLTQHVHETTRLNNILDLVISTEEELIVNLKVTEKLVTIKHLHFQQKLKNYISHQKKKLQL